MALEGAWQPDANQDSGGGRPGGRPDALYTR